MLRNAEGRLEIPGSFEHENGFSCFTTGEQFVDYLSEYEFPQKFVG